MRRLKDYFLHARKKFSHESPLHRVSQFPLHLGSFSPSLLLCRVQLDPTLHAWIPLLDSSLHLFPQRKLGPPTYCIHLSSPSSPSFSKSSFLLPPLPLPTFWQEFSCDVLFHFSAVIVTNSARPDWGWTVVAGSKSRRRNKRTSGCKTWENHKAGGRASSCEAYVGAPLEEGKREGPHPPAPRALN